MFGLLHSVQIFIFFKSVGLGILLGGFYLLFSAFRYFFSHIWFAVFAEDILFFIVFAVTTFLFLFVYNAGIPRFYVFVGESVGLFLAGTVFRGVFRALLRKISVRKKSKRNVLDS